MQSKGLPPLEKKLAVPCNPNSVQPARPAERCRGGPVGARSPRHAPRPRCQRSPWRLRPPPACLPASPCTPCHLPQYGSCTDCLQWSCHHATEEPPLTDRHSAGAPLTAQSGGLYRPHAQDNRRARLSCRTHGLYLSAFMRSTSSLLMVWAAILTRISWLPCTACPAQS